jgi:hypothetical protein
MAAEGGDTRHCAGLLHLAAPDFDVHEASLLLGAAASMLVVVVAQSASTA